MADLYEPKYYNTRTLPPRRPSRSNRITAKIEAWFARHQRPLPWRVRYDPYHVWVSEVMLQQTRMEVVLGYFERFLDRFPTVADLARSTEEEVLAAWSGLGYYRRARMLRSGAIDVMTRFGGVIPSTVDELLTISGIGRYTAGAIASIAHQQHAPIVDGNVARVLSRIEGIDAPGASPALMSAAWKHAEELVRVCVSSREMNQGLMEVGALICKPANPSCLLCPLRDECYALLSGRVAELPGKKVKKETRALRIPLWLITDRRGHVLMRRESGALMTSMYHLPHGNASLLGSPGLEAIPLELLGTIRHTVTTRRISFELFTAELPDRLGDDDAYAWIDPRSMANVPHPSYVAKALALAKAGGSSPTRRPRHT